MEKDKHYIYVCSPYSGVEENYIRALNYGAYVFAKGAIPIIPHTMYHGILDDKNPVDRERGLQAGKALLKICDRVWVFGKQGAESVGMLGEIKEARSIGIPIEYIDGSKAMEPNERSQALSVCMRHYEKNYNNLSRVVADDIIYYIDAGLLPEVVCEAINEAARREAKWVYAKRILERCIQQGITTLEAFKAASGKKESAAMHAAYDLEAFERMLDNE